METVPRLDAHYDALARRDGEPLTDRLRAAEAAERQRQELAQADKLISLGTLVSSRTRLPRTDHRRRLECTRSTIRPAPAR